MIGTASYDDDQNTQTGYLDILHAYESLWLQDQRPDLIDFIENLPEGQRRDLALDLLRIEFRQRKKRGERPRLDDYLDSLPVDLSSALHEVEAELSSRDPYASLTLSQRGGEEFTAEATLQEGDRIGRYIIERLIGRGGFGTVWLAEDPQLKRKVAIKIPKVISADSNRNILAEAQKAASLDHPHIVPVYDVGQHERHGYIVSRLMTGGTLKDYLAKHRFSVDEGVRLVLQIVETLDFAHKQGIHHRDMKPGNVLRSSDGTLHITDFGLAKSESADFSVIESSSIAGTPAYMPPEQILEGQLGSEAAVDIYATGVILYEVLCRQRPRRGTRFQEVVVETLAGKPIPTPSSLNPDISPELEHICLKAIDPDPECRYQTAAELAADLRLVLQDWAEDDRPLVLAADETTIMPAPPARPAKRWPMWLGAAVVMVVLAGLGAGSLLRPPDGLIPVEVEVTPPEAKLTFIPLTSDTGIPRPEETVSVPAAATVRTRLAPGIYLVEAVVSDRQFHEVYRTVPAPDASSPRAPFGHARWKRNPQGTVLLPEIKVPDKPFEGLVEVAGTTSHVIAGTNPPRKSSVPTFSVMEDLVRFPVWKSNGNALPRLESRMKNDEVLNAGIELGQVPLIYVSWDEAANLAESMGMRLPDELELEVAHRGGKLGEDSPDYAEWTANWTTSLLPLGEQKVFMPASPLHRVARGPFENGNEVPRLFLDCRDVYENVALRFVRSSHPRLRPEDFVKTSD